MKEKENQLKRIEAFINRLGVDEIDGSQQSFILSPEADLLGERGKTNNNPFGCTNKIADQCAKNVILCYNKSECGESENDRACPVVIEDDKNTFTQCPIANPRPCS